eukprot:IDg10685t1
MYSSLSKTVDASSIAPSRSATPPQKIFATLATRVTYRSRSTSIPIIATPDATANPAVQIPTPPLSRRGRWSKFTAIEDIIILWESELRGRFNPKYITGKKGRDHYERLQKDFDDTDRR